MARLGKRGLRGTRTLALRVATAIAIVSSSGTARADVEPFTLFRSLRLHGGFVAGATCVRDLPPRDRGTIVISGIPPGATVVEAWMWYDGLRDHLPLPVPAGTPTINGLPVSPVQAGVVLRVPWPSVDPQATAFFRADVTSIVTGNGTFVLESFPTIGVGVEGATIAAIYSDPAAPEVEIVIYDGADVVNSAVTVHTQTLTGFTAGKHVTASWLAVIGNGVEYVSPGDPDDLRFNDTPMETLVPTEDVLAGRACPGYTSKEWDLGLYDVSSLVPPGSSSASVTLNYIDDYYTPGAYVLAVTPCVDRPSVVRLLKGIKLTPDDARWSWDDEPASTGYWLQAVTAKAEIPGAAAAGSAACVGAVAGCLLSGSVPPPPTLVFYQAIGTCGALDGPVELP